MPHWNTTSALAAGTLAGVGASLCCVGPLVLLAFGISGAWIGNLTVFEPFRPYFIGLTFLFLGLAFRKLYREPQACADVALCGGARALQRRRLIFWLVAALLLSLLMVPWTLPFFYD